MTIDSLHFQPKQYESPLGTEGDSDSKYALTIKRVILVVAAAGIATAAYLVHSALLHMSS